METELIVAVEGLADAREERGLGVEPRHFVFVLDRQQAEILPRYHFGELRAAQPDFGSLHPRDERTIAPAQRRILIGCEFGNAPVDHLVKVARKTCIGTAAAGAAAISTASG